MQVDAVATDDVVLMTRVDEEVGVGACVDAGLHEREGVLRYAGIVMVVVDDEQVAYEGTGQTVKVTFGIAVGVALRGVHVALAIHHFVVAPVYNGSAGYTHFEEVGVAEQ